MIIGLRLAIGSTAAILLLGAAWQSHAPRTASVLASGEDQPVLAEVPPALIERFLDAARAEAGNGELDANYRLLEQLAFTHASQAGEQAPFELTPRVASLLARNGLQRFLAQVLGAPGRSSAAASSLSKSGEDTEPPEVFWEFPAEGASVTPETGIALFWNAVDESFIYWADLYASYDGGATFKPIYLGWWPGTNPRGVRQYPFPLQYFPYRPGPVLLRVNVTDSGFNVGSAQRAITLTTVLDSRLPTTLRDFDVPGTQTLETYASGGSCASCHANFNRASEPDFPWRGSMMAHGGRDPLFDASLAIAEQDAGGSGDLCFRCHDPAVWMNGWAVPSDGSQLGEWQRTGVGCETCHRMVDPVFTPGESPVEDLDVLAGLADPPSVPGNGSYVLDPNYQLRGPFEDTACAHFRLVSPFHQKAELCASCHDQSNPLFESDGAGGFVAGAFDQRASSFAHGELMPVDRTFSEWLHSDFNSPGGVHAPEFGGNRDTVSTCQDCHMRDVTGPACYFDGVPVRDDQPFHDLTGGNTWMPKVLAALDRFADRNALDAAVERARYMLQNAAELKARKAGSALEVTVINKTGHKLPGGYPLGRRMWLNVRFFDSASVLVGESGHYDLDTGVLGEDAGIKVYRVVAGLSDDVATMTGLPPGPSLHGALNNEILADNRIPPRGFTNAAFASFGGAPVGTSYADGQNWDVTTYPIPAGASRVTVTLYYQTTTKEYVEFLRDENHTDRRGKRMHELWEQHGRCPPEVMREVSLSLEGKAQALAPAPTTPLVPK